MKKRTLLGTLILVLVSTVLSAQFTQAIRAFVDDSSFTSASISISVMDISSGKLIASHNENMSLGSASVIKLVTTASALEILGGDFRFKTRIGYTGLIDSKGTLNGHIVIKGGGDPALGSERFPDHYKEFLEEWRDAIIHSGIKAINGRVVADASIFNYQPVSGGWSWADLGNYYGAGAHGLSINDNMYRIHFRTGPSGRKPEVLALDPEVPGLIVNNLLVAEGWSDKGYVYIEPYGDYAEIRGTIPINRNDFVLKASIPDPPQLTASLLYDLLLEGGVKIKLLPTSLRVNNIVSGEDNNIDAVVLHVTYSPELSKIVSATNSESINMFAENLLRMISVNDEPDSPGSISHGIDVVKSLLEERGIGTKGLYITDGSGLSRYNAVSSLFMVKLLTYMKTESSQSEIFYHSLPRAGEEGTLKDYFKDPVFKGRISAKSGTATRIRNYAGYLTTLSGDQYSFAILVNNFDCTTSEVTAKVEILLKDIIEAQ